MLRGCVAVLLAGMLLIVVGCQSCPCGCGTGCADAGPVIVDGPAHAGPDGLVVACPCNHVGEAHKKAPKTLFEWAICKKDEPSEEDEEKKANGKDQQNGAGEDKNSEQAPNQMESREQSNGHGEDMLAEYGKKRMQSKTNGENGNGAEEEEDEIQTDRPDFTEASTTVGRGRIQLESGYTYFRDRTNGTRMNAHSYPEALLRIGMFAEWFELRLGQNFGSERETGPDGITQTASGAFDLYLGTKIALTEQQRWLPEMALITQMTVPSGSRDFSSDEVLPGLNLLYGWDVIKDCLSLGGSTQANRVRGVHTVPGFLGLEEFPAVPESEVKHSHLLLAQSLTVGYTLTKRLGAYTEWFALFPHSSIDPDVGPEHYFDGGFTYKVRPNVQLDVRAGFGLNKHATDFFAGPGFSFRY